MTDEDKVGHLLKGIAEDVYNFLITKDDLSTPSDLKKHCRAFEALKMRRIGPKFGRLDNVTTIASVSVPTHDDLSSVIRQVVKEELQRLKVVDDAHVCHQCAFDHRSRVPPSTWAPQSFREPRRTYADRTESSNLPPQPTSLGRRQDAPQRFVPRAIPSYNQPESAFLPMTPMSPVSPATSRDSRICYSCGVPGHIARYCHRRQQRAPRFNSYTPRVPADEPWPYPTSFQRLQQGRANRSDSPVSDRSLTPPPTRQRRSPSPRRRSLSPPPLGN